MAQKRISVALAAAMVSPAAPPQARGRREADQRDGLRHLLDEIDDVLEENAEDFVRAYVKRADGDSRCPIACVIHSLEHRCRPIFFH